MRERLEALGIALVLLTAVFWPLERLFSARKGQAWLRPRFVTDVAFMAGQYLVWAALALWVLVKLDGALGLVVPTALRERVESWPWAAQALLVVMLGDVSVYWFHVASHRVPLLWRFHSIHHSSRHLDWIAAHREHPVDGLLTQLAINLPAMALGVDVSLLAGLIAFRGLWAIFIHSNVKLPLGPLRVLFGAPELHHWHHLETTDTKHNFANLAPWTDLLFGTYHCPEGEETWPLGNPGEAPRGYLAHLVSPFRLEPRPSGNVEDAALVADAGKAPAR
ncbi:MAG: sterol desaturase family protein [Archangium sp.]|nr:sterol desaturase family protein [Archangium sp.]